MTRPRRTAALAATVLAAALLPVGLASPSYASPGCLSDRRPRSSTRVRRRGPAGDDPDRPRRAQRRRVGTSTMTFTFAGAHRRRHRRDRPRVPAHRPARRTTGRPAPARAPTPGSSTPTSRTPSGCGHAPATLRPRATHEPGRTSTPPAASRDAPGPGRLRHPDAYDEQTPQRPVVPSRRLPIRLNSNERDARFECLLDAEGHPCTPGAWVLADVASGDHVFTARAVDRAGTPSAWSEPFAFSVPRRPEAPHRLEEARASVGRLRRLRPGQPDEGRPAGAEDPQGRRAAPLRADRAVVREGARPGRQDRLAHRRPGPGEGGAAGDRGHRPVLRHPARARSSSRC